MTAEDVIRRLNLVPHPEGGYFRETYRSDEKISKSALPERYSGDRVFSTAIYFLLQSNENHLVHRLKSDEIWHFYL
ncbi:MAG TPA: cupin domain-containing protein, partial [Candidatus Kapabacteria bacterium]|nr:cupin domain-containing protein [Candidatus Kapabacteria bacterium]